MLTENDVVRKLMGVDVWHKKGYTGKYAAAAGYAIGSFEQTKSSHGYDTCFAAREIALDAPVLEINSGDAYNFIKNNNITVAFRSLELGDTIAENMKFPEDIMDKCLLLHAAGNDSNRVDDSIMDRPEWFGIAAASTADMTATGYSNRSDDILCAAPGLVYVKYASGSVCPTYGTSFAAPFTAAAAFLLDDLAVQKRGWPFTGREKALYLQDFAVDVGPAGFDVQTGYGFLKLPDPDTIDVYKHAVALDIGSSVYSVYGDIKTMDVAPQIVNDRTMVPVRFVAEALGRVVLWDAKNRKVIIPTN